MHYTFKHTVTAVKWDGDNYQAIYDMTARFNLENTLIYDGSKSLYVGEEEAALGEYVVVWPTVPGTIQSVLYDEVSFEHQFGKLH